MSRKLYHSLDPYSVPPEISNEYKKLSAEKKRALDRMLQYEEGKEDGFALRKQFTTDLYQFDHSLNDLASKILALRHPVLTLPQSSPIFGKFSNVDGEIRGLKQHGYVVSDHQLPAKTLDSVLEALAKFRYASRESRGASILGADIQSSSESAIPIEKGGTFWLQDQSIAAHDPTLFRLAFDPYILSVVSEYLGCTPIHVQTNIWFSFEAPGGSQYHSKNAQLYHQDKEFTKFLKVFVYLNDVSEKNGPHCYVEGSHIDELFKHGVPLSTRLTDQELLKYYASDRLKTVTGQAGTILFGDTSAVHKGQPVLQGHRTLLQFEYASSLYLSPVKPFEGLTQDEKNLITHQGLDARVTQNYDSRAKSRYEKALASKKSTLRKLASRVVNKIGIG